MGYEIYCLQYAHSDSDLNYCTPTVTCTALKLKKYICDTRIPLWIYIGSTRGLL